MEVVGKGTESQYGVMPIQSRTESPVAESGAKVAKNGLRVVDSSGNREGPTTR